MGRGEGAPVVPPRMCLPVTAKDLAAIKARVEKSVVGYDVTVETCDTGQAYVCVESTAAHRSIVFAADDRHRHWGVLDWQGELLAFGASIEAIMESDTGYLIA
jgi:hypothetical protein